MFIDKVEVILAHPARQHSFQLAKALEINGVNYRYVTTVYLKKGNLTDLITKKILKGENRERAEGRRCEGLSDEKIIQFNEFLALFLLLLQRYKKLDWLYKITSDIIIHSFSKKLSKYIIKNNIKNVILFDQYAYQVIRNLNKNNYKANITLDMSAPNVQFMLEQYTDKIDQYIPKNDIYKKGRISKFEIKNSNFFLVASEFTKKSLGVIPKGRVFNCRYGISEIYIKDIKDIKDSFFVDKADVLFIGRLTREKGFDLFLKLADTTNFKINFKALGSVNSCDFIDLANIKNVALLGHVPKEQVYDYLDTTKILIMPSVADGFGFVVLEALARGVIVICSDNTGASDLINHGYNGFIFKTGDLDSLLQIFTNVMHSKYNLMEIRKNAINTAKEYDMSSYEESIAHYIQNVLNI